MTIKNQIWIAVDHRAFEQSWNLINFEIRSQYWLHSCRPVQNLMRSFFEPILEQVFEDLDEER